MMQVVYDLQEIGYTLALNNGAIKYQYTGIGEPDISKSAVLFAELKKEKQAAIEYLQRAEALAHALPVKMKNKAQITSKVDNKTVAIELVAGIREQALSLGWAAGQLEDFARTLSTFIPCRIGIITLQAIEIQLLWEDGRPRGCLHQYNHEVDLPWLKHQTKGREIRGSA